MDLQLRDQKSGVSSRDSQLRMGYCRSTRVAPRGPPGERKGPRTAGVGGALGADGQDGGVER